MGQRGPIPNPERTLRLRGTSRKDRQRSAPQPEVTRLDAPDWLAGEGRVMWDELGPKLRRLGLLTDLDLNSFARLCQLHGRWLAASRFIQENGRPTWALPDSRSATRWRRLPQTWNGSCLPSNSTSG